MFKQLRNFSHSIWSNLCRYDDRTICPSPRLLDGLICDWYRFGRRCRAWWINSRKIRRRRRDCSRRRRCACLIWIVRIFWRSCYCIRIRGVVWSHSSLGILALMRERGGIAEGGGEGGQGSTIIRRDPIERTARWEGGRQVRKAEDKVESKCRTCIVVGKWGVSEPAACTRRRRERDGQRAEWAI